MSQIKGKDTKPEIIVRKFLFSKGLRYRIHNTKLPGKPDITISSKKVAIFVNGCFWHKHEGCSYYVVPKTNTEFWVNKIDANVVRDKNNTEILTHNGWKVLTIWECEIENNTNQTLNNLLKDIYE